MTTEIPLPTIGRSIGDHAPPVFRGAPRKTGGRAKLGKIQTALLGSFHPASTARMKAGREHRVPLSTRAAAILKEMELIHGTEGSYVFPGRGGKPLSNMSMEMLLRRMKIENATVHGFRSSFRDWAAEETPFAREIAESALAHIVGDATERAYRRGDALERRRELMQAWAAYLAEEVGAS